MRSALTQVHRGGHRNAGFLERQPGGRPGAQNALALGLGSAVLVALMASLGLGTPLLFVLALPLITVNALNSYSSTLALGATFPKIKPWLFTVLGATAGTLFALAGILDYFIPFLVFLSLIIPPIAAIYVIDSFTLFRDVETEGSELIKPAIRWEAIGVWVASVAFTLAVPAERFTLTTVPALDATIIAGFGYVAVLRLKQFWAARRATSAL